MATVATAHGAQPRWAIRPSLLLAILFASGAEATPNPRDDGHHRMLPSSLQNMCGSSWSGAQKCHAYCPGGTNAECPSGEQCFADVNCPLAPTISPKPTRKPVRGFDLGNHNKQILGYYAGWQWYDRAKLAKPSNMDFSKVTRVNYAFFQTDDKGNIWGTDEWGDPRVLFGDVDAGSGACQAGEPRCRCSWVKPQFKSCLYHKDSTGLIYLVHQARADIYPSIGGWTLSDAFPPMSADPTSRAIFARNCRQLIVDYDFDGIDLDWEYPGYVAHSGTPADTENFNLLLHDVRRELDGLGAETGRFYGLTAALPCGPSNINNIDIGTVSLYLTEFNLMSYDFHGAWDTYTGTNSPLYDASKDPEPGWSVDGCVKNWLERGAPKEKLNIGLGFYGRSFRNAKGLGELHGGTDDTTWEVDEGTPQYFNIMERVNSMATRWDHETKTPYSFFNDHKGGLVSYDNEHSICLKTEYAIVENLHGFIIWELSGDMMDDLNTPLLDIVNRKLSETDTNCADPFGPKLMSPVTPRPTMAPATAYTTRDATTTTTTDPTTTTTTDPTTTTTTDPTTTTTTDPTTTTATDPTTTTATDPTTTTATDPTTTTATEPTTTTATDPTTTTATDATTTTATDATTTTTTDATTTTTTDATTTTTTDATTTSITDATTQPTADATTTTTTDATATTTTEEAGSPTSNTSTASTWPCADADSTYYEATADCLGYYLCMLGRKGSEYQCAGYQMLFDEGRQMCNWAEEVVCGQTVPSTSPKEESQTTKIITSMASVADSFAMAQFTQFSNGRKRVDRDKTKPEKPYRPTKEERSEL